ncbi:hypothetical protein ANO14919_113140 [Xylariales sp. No.14919]|nr:hypothetical protein ANO14919_113140 [Xylariales sp. No.14919]
MHPSVLFVTYPFLVGGVLPVLGWNHIANAAPHLVTGDELKRSSSSSYNHAMFVTVATFFEHATVDTDAPHNSTTTTTSGALANDQLETVTTMHAPGVVTVAPTPGPMRTTSITTSLGRERGQSWHDLRRDHVGDITLVFNL